MEFKDLSLKEIIGKIKSGETTQEEVYRYFLNRIDSVNPSIDAFNYINS
jgi:Asp-tRNA(Asn)/Glu-tRNA(Gln) amidotransferase A subunit family amidase